ncbi:MAG: hypothetical protein KC933_17905 [Myxococcales bacterium]|nr:hypothetical protein [Myxococcales bacterium]MCB9650702.1 hypothetical protein [Deltaproteobacteria bacterium]
MRTSLALAATAITLSTSACYLEIHDEFPDGLRGDLTLRYDFEGKRCDDAGVSRIRVQLTGQRFGERYDDDYSCSGYAWGVTFENLREDTYTVLIEGRDGMGSVLYQSNNQEVEVYGGTHQEYTLRAYSAGGALTLYWTFDGTGSCGAVDEVRVTLTDPDGFIYDDARYPCSYGGVVYDDLVEGLWRLGLDGLADDGRLLYAADPQNVVVIGAADNIYTIDLGAVR